MALLKSSVLSARTLSTTCRFLMPYKPEERLPLTNHQRKLYPQVEQEFTDEGYPILKLMPSSRNIFAARKKYTRRESRFTQADPREEKMPEDQDWPSVWPTAKTFSPSAVPLPLRQGYEDKPGRVPRGKYANTELVKIANFLHLTPKAVERHCQALQKFCNKWPEGLETDEDVRAHFPVTYVTKDYISATPTIRDVRARVVSIKVNIKDLKLDPNDEDKLVRLAGDKYNPTTGEIEIPASSCPTKLQNQDYSDYMLTALYFESINHEDWEEDKPECDWERFFWDKSESKAKLQDYLDDKQSDIEKEKIVDEYKRSLEQVFLQNKPESYDCYRSSVEKILGIQAK